MKLTFIKIIATFLCLLCSGYVAAQEHFDSSQLKKLRQTSNIILKSQSAEKKLVEREVEKEIVILTVTEQYIQNIIDQGIKVTAHNKASNTDPNNKKKSQLKKHSKYDASKLITHISSSKKTINDQLPSKWMFWKKSTKSDKRKQEVVRMLDLIEVEVQKDINANSVDVNKLKRLKNKLTLKSPIVADNKNRPTFIPYIGTGKQVSPPKRAVQ